MHFTSILFAALASTALAAPATASSSKGLPSFGPWNVTNYNENCSPGGCTYSFHVAFKGSKLEPAFSTVCKGTDEQKKPKPCANTTVFADLIPRKTFFALKVTHVYQEGPYETFVYGTHRLKDGVPPKKAFTIYPNHASS